MRMKDAHSLRMQMEQTFEKAAPVMTADEVIQNSALCKVWLAGKHTAGEVYMAAEQPWKCIQDYDNAVYTDIAPGQPAWGTFHTPYHGTTKETALPWVAPTGAHDIYFSGEYMIWTDGLTYHCIQPTNFSPAEYAVAWEVA